jgi:prophage regulatory protein
MVQLPQTGFLRLKHILGDKKTDTPALIPVSRSAWWLGIRNGIYPAGVKLGTRTTAWAVESIRALIASTKSGPINGRPK